MPVARAEVLGGGGDIREPTFDRRVLALAERVAGARVIEAQHRVAEPLELRREHAERAMAARRFFPKGIAQHDRRAPRLQTLREVKRAQ